MKVKWNRYETYEDGSQSTRSYGIITIGNENYEVTITDHTKPLQKESDIRHCRDVTHAYEISGLPYYTGTDCFYKLGFENYPALSSVGIDRNPPYGDALTYNFCYEGPDPEHTIEEVERLVEDAFVKAFCFDYNEELAKFKAELNERQNRMDEAISYQQLRDYELSHENANEVER